MLAGGVAVSLTACALGALAIRSLWNSFVEGRELSDLRMDGSTQEALGEDEREPVTLDEMADGHEEALAKWREENGFD